MVWMRVSDTPSGSTVVPEAGLFHVKQRSAGELSTYGAKAQSPVASAVVWLRRSCRAVVGVFHVQRGARHSRLRRVWPLYDLTSPWSRMLGTRNARTARHSNSSSQLVATTGPGFT